MIDIKAEIAAPHKLALYMRLSEHAWVTVFEVRHTDRDEHYHPLPEGQMREETIDGYVRISEPVDVQFSAIDSDAMVRNAVASLDEEERKLRSELNKKIADIRDRKNQLLALTHEVAA